MAFTQEQFDKLERSDKEYHKFVRTQTGEVAVRTNLESGDSCIFDGVYQTPSGQVSGTTCQDWIDLHFQSIPPTVSIRGTDFAFGLYEVGQTLYTPSIEGRGGLGGNPTGTLTQLDIAQVGFTQVNPTPGVWYGANDGDITIVNGVTKTYTANILDSEGRSASANGVYSGAYPFYVGWTDEATDIFDGITQAQLLALNDIRKIVKTKSNTSDETNPTNGRFVIGYPASYGNLTSIIDNNGFETISDYDTIDYGVVGLDGNTLAYRFYILSADTTNVDFTNNYIF